MGFECHFENDNTEQVKEELAQRVLTALDAVGLQASSLAKRELQKSPKRIDTGLLRNSITHAVAGKPPAIRGYHADKGSNRTKKGNRRKATSKFAGAVGAGFYAGNAPAPSDPEKPFVLVGTNVEYAVYVSEGTLYMAPNHFLKNAMMNNQGELRKIIQSVLSQ